MMYNDRSKYWLRRFKTIKNHNVNVKTSISNTENNSIVNVTHSGDTCGHDTEPQASSLPGLK